MKKKNRIGSVILGTLVTAALILFILLQREKNYQVEVLPEDVEGLDNWTLENSVSNGKPLDENKSIYENERAGGLTNVYITVFPTKDDTGNILTFRDFEKHKARDKSYNPILNANVVFGKEEEGLNTQLNVDLVNATIRVRGNSSRGATYKSYKIKFKEDVGLFEEQSTLNLNKHVSDISKITNKFCMDIMKPIKNIASFRTNFMIVYIRDASLPKKEQKYKYYGLYTHVEQPNKSYLKNRDFDASGSMYKANNFEFRMTEELKNIDDPLYDEEVFGTVLNISEGKDHTKLLKMLEAVNDMNQDFEKTFAAYFNEDNYLTWMACNILLGNEDTIAHNFIIYNPKDSLTWYFLPWDYDGTFKIGEYKSTFQVPLELKGIQRMSGVILHRRYFKQPGKIEKLTEKLEQLLEEYFTKEKVNNLINSYLPVMEKVLVQEPDLTLCQIPPNEYKDYLDGFYDQIVENYEDYKKAVEYPMPVFVSEPVKKENGDILFAWEPSYDFQNDFLSYDIKVAEDINMEHVIFEQKNLAENTYLYKEGLTSGTYFLSINITDSNGNTQYSLDYYENIGEKMHFGIRQFIIK